MRPLLPRRGTPVSPACRAPAWPADRQGMFQGRPVTIGIRYEPLGIIVQNVFLTPYTLNPTPWTHADPYAVPLQKLDIEYTGTNFPTCSYC